MDKSFEDVFRIHAQPMELTFGWAPAIRQFAGRLTEYPHYHAPLESGGGKFRGLVALRPPYRKGRGVVAEGVVGFDLGEDGPVVGGRRKRAWANVFRVELTDLSAVGAVVEAEVRRRIQRFEQEASRRKIL